MLWWLVILSIGNAVLNRLHQSSNRAVYTGWSCPSGPAEFVDFLVDRGTEVDYETFAEHVDLSTSPLDGWQIDLLPTDWAVIFLQTALPTGADAWVLQHSGIEHLFLAPGVHFDCAIEGALARRWAE